MKRTQLRSRLASVAFVILVAAAWLYLAPTQIGGATTYLATSGISMEPRFHAGDLALVRPADRYSVGEVVAYRSTLLHTIVLHRIVARDGDRYVFKGDNNNFLDPTRPTRSLLVGALWLRIPRGGRALALLHSPPVVGAVLGAIILLLLGTGEERRRRDRRRRSGGRSARAGARPMSGRDNAVPSDNRALLGALAAVVVCLLLGLFAFTRPVRDPALAKIAYSQGVTFGYSASAPAGPVYPDGVVSTGDPIFLTLVHRIRVQIAYHLRTTAPHALVGSEGVIVRLTGPGGWTRSMQVTPTVRFTGDQANAQVTLGLPYLQSLFAQVARLTGAPATAGYTISVIPQVRIGGLLAGRPLNATFNPVLGFQVSGVQLLPGVNSGALAGGAGAGASAGTPGTLTSSQSGAAYRTATAANTVTVLGRTFGIAMLRWLSIVGFVVAGASALLLLQLKRREPFAETARIQSRYGHLIVPIVGATDLAGRRVFDVTSIKSLVALAERSERLILHQYGDSADTFLVDDEGTVYRYRTRPTGVVWSDRPAVVPQAARPAEPRPVRPDGGVPAVRAAAAAGVAGGAARPGGEPSSGGDAQPAAAPQPTAPATAAATAAAPAGSHRSAPAAPVVRVRVDERTVHPVVPIGHVLRIPTASSSPSAGSAGEVVWPPLTPAAPVDDRPPEAPAPAADARPAPAPVASGGSVPVGEAAAEAADEGPAPAPVASAGSVSVGDWSPEALAQAADVVTRTVPATSADPSEPVGARPPAAPAKVPEATRPAPARSAEPVTVPDPPRVPAPSDAGVPRPDNGLAGWRSRARSGRGLWGELHRKRRDEW